MEALLAAFACAVIAVQGSQTVPASSRITGVVIEPVTHEPVAGARVVLAPPDEPPSSQPHPREALSDPSGQFAFDGVAPGRYRLAALKNGFAIPMNDAVLPVVDLASGDEVTGVIVPVERGGVISGVVLDPSGRAVPHESVIALLKRLDTVGLLSDQSVKPPTEIDGGPVLLPLGHAETNARGEFRL